MNPRLASPVIEMLWALGRDLSLASVSLEQMSFKILSCKLFSKVLQCGQAASAACDWPLWVGLGQPRLLLSGECGDRIPLSWPLAPKGMAVGTSKMYDVGWGCLSPQEAG